MNNTISAFSGLDTSFVRGAQARAQRGTLVHSAHWRAAVARRLKELVALQAGWDGYKAIPVKAENASFALELLGVICDVHTQAPQIVPGTSGDLQIEWHTAVGDVEIHIAGPNKVHVWYSIAADDDDGVSCEPRSNFKMVAVWVKEIAGDEIATQPAIV
ncbi:hypothetical protein [Duganella sp. BuS-21]|uniref:hypothetical protein n=1 Tax=Duganella sp. BuS-21 TaxID=2943848 RepID=UPI0035A5A6EB